MHLPKFVSPVPLSTPIHHQAYLRPHSWAWVPAPDWKQGLQPWVPLLQIIEPEKSGNKVDLDFLKPPIAVPVAVVSVAALVRRGQVKPLDQFTRTIYKCKYWVLSIRYQFSTMDHRRQASMSDCPCWQSRSWGGCRGERRYRRCQKFLRELKF